MSIILNGTSGVTYPDGVLQSSGVPAPGTSGNVLTSNGTNWTSSANPPAFASGTRLGFQQTSAPTGWTKDTTAAINDSILRFVTGSVSSGGSLAFSTWAAQTADGATTLSTAQMPSHTHSSGASSSAISWITNSYINASPSAERGLVNSSSPGTGSAGGGGSHTHSLSQSLKYYDFIIASKD